MHFSAGYTRWAIVPHAYEPPGRPRQSHPGRSRRSSRDRSRDRLPDSPPGFTLNLTLTVALEIDWEGVGTTILESIITDALNIHAGGRRTFTGTDVHVTWSLSWTDALRVQIGSAMGVALIPEDLLAGAHVGGLCVHSAPDSNAFCRVVLPAFTPPPPAPRRRRRGSLRRRRHRRTPPATDRFRRTSSHEVGHGLGLSDERTDSSTTMYYRALTAGRRRRLDQRWTDDELRQALRNVIPDGDRPEWLR